MRKFLQNKLWRDKAPELMEKMGSIIHLKNLNDQEFDHQLRLKLLEEAQKVQDAKSKQELINEIADIFEVIDSLCELHQMSLENIKMVQTKKKTDRGGFAQRKFVTIAEHPEGGFGEQYCLATPEKYPEITTTRIASAMTRICITPKINPDILIS